jgi:hypothetical protein
MPSTFDKDPNAVLDYTVDWEDWLVGSDTIATSTWSVPSGITKDSDTKSTTAATIWLSGGAHGTNYALVNRIVTASGRTDDRTITVQVRSK